MVQPSFGQNLLPLLPCRMSPYALHDTGLPHRIDRILCPYANTPVVGIERRTGFDLSIQHRIKALQDNCRLLP